MIGHLIHSPLEYFARHTPDHPALACQHEEMSYADLDRRSNQLANALLDKGVSQGDRIGIHMHKSLELGVAIYGILKAGCAFVPIDPFLPRERIGFILADCNIRHVLTNDALVKNLRADDGIGDNLVEQIDGELDGNINNAIEPLHIYGLTDTTCTTDYSWRHIAHYAEHSPNLELIDQALGYIMYTSGSTGVPKGMMHTHLGSITYARWGADHVQMSASDRVASHAPLHFDLSIFDFFSTAQSGATVVLVPETVTRFAASWTRLIDTERISIVFTVPYTLITMLEQGALDDRDLSSLRWVLFGGEPFPPDKLRRLMLRLEHTRFTNVYGPAEAPSCTCHIVPLPDDNSDDPIPIGLVSRNSSAIIIDGNDDDCADGQAGELCIRSTTLTRGYWNRPDLNERAFLCRQGVEAFPMVYYRTGDRVVRGKDGLLRFLGRIGRMVKIRGQRVELDEVESVLASHADVTEVAAITLPSEHDSLQIVCAVTLKDDADADAGTLLKLARTKLPPYAVPSVIRLLTELPHTSTGKLNRKQLADSWSHDVHR